MLQPKLPSQGLDTIELAEQISEQEVRRLQRRQRQALHRAKDEFIAISSHQLRTPATCVKLYLGMILEGFAGEVPDGLRPYIQKAYDNNEKQLGLVSTLLQVADVDSGAYAVHPSPQNACKIVQEAIEACQLMIALRGQRVVYNHPEECLMVSDPEKVKIVLVKIIENATKNSPAGSVITIGLRQSKKYIRISIHDNGAGMAREDMRRIFEKFTRIDNEVVDTVNGNGLGLYVARKITKKLGGTLTVVSEPRAGSTFTLKFPAQS